jgi:hypothetical protein
VSRVCIVMEIYFNRYRNRSILKRKSLQMTKGLSNSVGGYLPNTLTEMWEPSRDFAFLRLPTSGARCIVALSGSVSSDLPHIKTDNP